MFFSNLIPIFRSLSQCWLPLCFLFVGYLNFIIGSVNGRGWQQQQFLQIILLKVYRHPTIVIWIMRKKRAQPSYELIWMFQNGVVGGGDGTEQEESSNKSEWWKCLDDLICLQNPTVYFCLAKYLFSFSSSRVSSVVVCMGVSARCHSYCCCGWRWWWWLWCVFSSSLLRNECF